MYQSLYPPSLTSLSCSQQWMIHTGAGKGSKKMEITSCLPSFIDFHKDFVDLYTQATRFLATDFYVFFLEFFFP